MTLLSSSLFLPIGLIHEAGELELSSIVMLKKFTFFNIKMPANSNTLASITNQTG